MEKRLFLKDTNGGLIAELLSFTYNAKRMGGAPTISATLHSFDELTITTDDYVEFNGEKYYIKHTPTSSKSNTDARYKYDLEFVSERIMLDEVYFHDASWSTVSGVSKAISKGSNFSFIGSIITLADRINASLAFSKIEKYKVVVSDEFKEVEEVEDKFISFSDVFVSNAIQEFYNTFKIPYYFYWDEKENKTIILVTNASATSPNVSFEYGSDNALLSITKTNANYKIINKCTGVGSSENLPYYYPNVSATGEHSFDADSDFGDININYDLLDKHTNLRDGATLTYHTKPKAHNNSYGWWYYLYEKPLSAQDNLASTNSMSFSATLQFTLQEHSYYTTPIKVYFSAYQGEKLKLMLGVGCQKVGDNIEDDVIPKEDVIIENVRVLYDGDTEVDGFDFNDGIVSFVAPKDKQYKLLFDVVLRQYRNDEDTDKIAINTSLSIESISKKYNEDYFTFDDNDKEIDVSLSGVKVTTPKDGGKIVVSATENWIEPQQVLMPSIYRGTNGVERYYIASNEPVTSEGHTYDFDGHQFTNPFSEGRPKEHIITVDDLKPTIKGMLVNDERIDMFRAFDYDEGDNDEIDDKNLYKHPFFYAKLKRLDFNLFDQASEKGEMTISFTSGKCAACNFAVVVDEKTKKNLVQVDDDGNLVFDENGVVKQISSYQSKQQDTINNEVWIALRKEDSTMGVVMPNVSNNAKPTTEDTFVITNINLPLSYILNAENQLENKIKEYLVNNNDDKFNFSIKFSRIYLAENKDVRDSISENSILSVIYQGKESTLYVSSYTYKMAAGEPLPEITVELSDTLASNNGVMRNVINQVKMEVMTNVANVDVVAQGARAFIRKDQNDQTAHRITANEVDIITNSNIGGGLSVGNSATIGGEMSVGRKATFNDALEAKGDITVGDYTEVLGEIKGAKVAQDGSAVFKSIRASYLEVFTLIYNQIRASSAYTIFDDSATVIEVEHVEGSESIFKITFEGDADYVQPFDVNDIIHGYVNKLNNYNYSISGECWLRVTEIPTTENGLSNSQVLAVLYSNSQVPSGFNIAPTKNMVLAHQGNADDTKKERQRTFYISSKDGYIVQLLDVNSPKLFKLMDEEENHNNYSNYGVVMGRLPKDLYEYIHNSYSFIKEEDPILYARYLAVENLLRIDYAGRPIKSENYQGQWNQEDANNGEYRVTDTTYTTVTHNGSLWKCEVDRTTVEPSDNTTEWTLLVAKGDKGDNGAVANANLLLNSNFDLFLPNAWSKMPTVTQDYAIFSESYGEKWVSLTRQANANQAALVKLLDGVYTPRYENFSYDDDGIYWCFVGAPDDFVIYNRLTGPSKALTASSITSGSTLSMVDVDSAIHWYMSMVPNSDNTMFVATKNENTLGINSYKGLSSGGNLALYSVVGDRGSQWSFTSHPKKLALWSGQQGVVIPNALDGFNEFIFTNVSVGAEMVVPFKIQSGKSYTLSFWTKNANPNNSDSSYVSGIVLGIPKDSGFTFSNLVGLEDGSWFTDRIDLKSGSTPTWERQSVTFSYTSSDGADYAGVVFIRLYLWANGGTASFSQLKLENGEIATAYQKNERDFMLPVKSTVFKRGSSKPSVPTGGSYDSPMPEGWSDGIPEGNGTVYSSTCTFYAGGYDTGWSGVQMLSDSADFDVAYCLKEQYTMQPPSEHPDGENEDWQNSPSEDAIWMATSNKSVGGTWSSWTITRVKGEGGKDGLSPNENLLLNTNFDVFEDDGKTLKSWTTQQGSIIKEGFEGFNVFSPVYQLGTTMPTLEAGKLYTFSLYQKSSATSGINTLIPSVNFANLIVSSNAHCAYNRDDNKIYFYFTEGVWQRASFTFRPTVDTTVIGFVLDNNSNKLWYLSRIKLEEGDTATAYQKHPDDLIGEDGEDGADGKDAPMTQNNLIQNSNFKGFSNKAMSGWVTNNTNQIGVAENGYNNQNYVTSKGAGLQTEAISSLDNMRKYVFSVYVRPSSANDFKVSFFANSNISVVTSDGSIVYDDSSSATVTFGVAAGVWTRVSVTISAADYGNFYIKFWSESDTFRISMPKLEEGEVVTPYIPAVADLTGPAGAAGEAVFPFGDWMNDVRYVRGDNYTISVHYLIDDKYYRLKKSFPEETVGIDPHNTEYWEFITEIAAIYAEFIMANFAMFGSKRGGVFYDRYLFSQWGINAENKEVYFSDYRDNMFIDKSTDTDTGPRYVLNGSFIPNMFIDFLSGALKVTRFSEPFIVETEPVVKVDYEKNHNILIKHDIVEGQLGITNSNEFSWRNHLVLLPEYDENQWIEDGQHFSILMEHGGATYGLAWPIFSTDTPNISWKNIYTVVGVDDKLLKSNFSNNGYSSGEYEGNWFIWKGMRTKFVLLTPGIILKLRLYRNTSVVNGEDVTVNYWHIENSTEFSIMNAYVRIVEGELNDGYVTLSNNVSCKISSSPYNFQDISGVARNLSTDQDGFIPFVLAPSNTLGTYHSTQDDGIVIHIDSAKNGYDCSRAVRANDGFNEL